MDDTHCYQHCRQSSCSDVLIQQQSHSLYGVRPLRCRPPPPPLCWSSPHFYASSPANLRRDVPAYRRRGPASWRRRASPPLVTRCLSTASSPFASGDRRPAAADSARPWRAGHDYGGLAVDERGGAVAMARRSERVCRSLIDTTQRPDALNDAICMYIDYLQRDNDRVIGQFALIDSHGRQLAVLFDSLVWLGSDKKLCCTADAQRHALSQSKSCQLLHNSRNKLCNKIRNKSNSK